MSDIPQTNPPSPTISWSVHEFEKKERGRDWHWTVGLVFGLAAVVAFFYGSIFFGIFLIIAGAVMIIYARKEPKLILITIDEKGITINGGLIPHEKIIQFWLDETGKPDKLLLQVKGSFVPVISLPLEGVSAQVVRDALKPNAKEELIRESRSIALFDRFGF